MSKEEGSVTLDTIIITLLTPSVAGMESIMAALKLLEPTMGGLTQTKTDKWLA